MSQAKKLKENGQSASEYALLIALVLAVFVGMQTYVKRGIQAAIKENVDEFGIQQEEGERTQQDLGLRLENSTLNTVSKSEERIELLQNGARKRTLPQYTDDDQENNIFTTSGTGNYTQETK
jgi:uncharacterized protein (UPF0333 family)